MTVQISWRISPPIVGSIGHGYYKKYCGLVTRKYWSSVDRPSGKSRKLIYRNENSHSRAIVNRDILVLIAPHDRDESVAEQLAKTRLDRASMIMTSIRPGTILQEIVIGFVQ